jgi:hypothetical protein
MMTIRSPGAFMLTLADTEGLCPTIYVLFPASRADILGIQLVLIRWVYRGESRVLIDRTILP